MFTFQAVQILIFLIPGFIAARILEALVVRKQEYKELEIIIEALIFSLLIYTISSFAKIPNPVALDSKNSSVLFPAPWSFVFLIIISLALAILFALVLNQGWFMRLMRWAKITRKTSRLSVWNDVFTEKSHRIIIDFADGRQVFGWVEYFSDYSDKPLIYLAQPQWIEDGKYIITGLDGMLITPDQKISFVEFLKDSDLPKEGDKNVTE